MLDALTTAREIRLKTRHLLNRLIRANVLTLDALARAVNRLTHSSSPQTALFFRLLPARAVANMLLRIALQVGTGRFAGFAFSSLFGVVLPLRFTGLVPSR